MAGSATAKSQSINLNAFSAPIQADIKAAPAGVIADIVSVATSLGKQHGFSKAQTAELVDTSVATSAVETGGSFNPSIVGDQGTSFGLFQLHQGGELGSNTEAWADNPVNNATRAIGTIADTMASEPNVTPGQIAANAQRPADQTGYARDVNGDLNLSGASGVGGNAFGLGSAGGTTATTTVGTTTTGAAQSSGNLLAKVGGFLLGTLLIGVGLVIVFKDTGAGQAVAGTAKDAGKVAAVAAA